MTWTQLDHLVNTGHSFTILQGLRYQGHNSCLLSEPGSSPDPDNLLSLSSGSRYCSLLVKWNCIFAAVQSWKKVTVSFNYLNILTEEIRLTNIWISRYADFPCHSFEWRRLFTWKPVWNFGDSWENVLQINKDFPKSSVKTFLEDSKLTVA